MSDKGVCKAATATPGLLMTEVILACKNTLCDIFCFSWTIPEGEGGGYDLKSKVLGHFKIVQYQKLYFIQLLHVGQDRRGHFSS